MQRQLALPLMHPQRVLRPREGIEAALFVKELLVLRSLAAGEEQVIRRVKLRPGLNILWAKVEPEGEAGAGEPEVEAGLSGHAAGKTTFCRLLRYALGEAHFGDDGLRRALRATFPEAWLLAEVHVRGEPWVVCRPFGVGAHPFVLRGAELSQAFDAEVPREELALYLQALDGLVRDQDGEELTLPSSRLAPGAHEAPLRFAHLLPWLARDQECRLSDLLAWRDPASDSGAPQLDSAERQALVRAVLGLLSTLEIRELATYERLLQERRALRERVPLLRHQAETDRDRLARALGQELPDLSGGLFREVVRQQSERRRAEIAERRANLPQGPDEATLKALLAQLMAHPDEGSTSAGHALDGGAAAATEVAPTQSGAPTAVVPSANQSGAPLAVVPSATHCGVPLQQARAAGCPLHTGPQVQTPALAPLRSVAPLPTAEPLRLSRSDASAAAALAQLRGEQSARERAIWEVAAEEAELRRLSALGEQTMAAHEEAERLALALERADEALLRSQERQQVLREQQAQTLAHLSGLFELVLRALLGEGVTARIDLAGRSLNLRLSFHGERHSAALDTLKIIAFDLTALSSAVEGRGCFPGFLIHDGPREADMSPDLYRRIFHYVRRLEERAAATCGGVPFQYIITTTEPPPAELCREPWLLLPPLSAARPEGRLLRVDL